MKEEISPGFLLSRKKLPDSTYSEKKEPYPDSCCGFWFVFLRFLHSFDSDFHVQDTDKVVDADLLCVWGICDHSTQIKKDAVGMKGYKV